MIKIHTLSVFIIVFVVLAMLNKYIEITPIRKNRILEFPKFYKYLGSFTVFLALPLFVFTLNQCIYYPTENNKLGVFMTFIGIIFGFILIFRNKISQYYYDDDNFYIREFGKIKSYSLGQMDKLTINLSGNYKVLMKNNTFFVVPGKILGFEEFWDEICNKYVQDNGVALCFHYPYPESDENKKEFDKFLDLLSIYIKNVNEGFIISVNFNKLTLNWAVLLSYPRKNIAELKEFLNGCKVNYPLISEITIKFESEEKI